MVKATGKSLAFFLFWLWKGWVDLHFCLTIFMLYVLSDTSGFTSQKKSLLVFLSRKHINWKFFCSLWCLLARAEILSHALRVEKVWHFMNVHKNNSKQYFYLGKSEWSRDAKMFFKKIQCSKLILALETWGGCLRPELKT